MSEDEGGAYLRSEQVKAIVQCNSCDYWNEMVGYIEPDNRKVVQFVCPQCDSIEIVANVWGSM